MGDSDKEIIIYTDGACSGNPGPGGWGAVLYYGDQKKEIFGSEKSTTNNRMELSAAINALKQVKKLLPVTVYTDSKYVKDGITSWIKKWRINNWRGSDKKPVKNADLWKELDQLISQMNVTFLWVQAHNGNIGNELADKLAVKGRDAAI